MNYSAQKEIVLKALKDNVVHPTAEYLCERIREVYPTLGVATVYRNLNKMAEGGVIKKIDGLEQKAHFDHNTHEHYHMMCDKCKRILMFLVMLHQIFWRKQKMKCIARLQVMM